jgi:NAD(P)-dependent dehydrogenase (short-subunit alcohol dehydrogenase family)
MKTWFITGASSGFGTALVEEVILRGDYAIGSLRRPEQIAEFNKKYAGKASAIPLDMNNTAQIAIAAKEALAVKGRIDVLVNNAGYGLFGAIEEASEAEAREQMETNFFGPLFLTQSILPAMRKAKTGHIVQISSVAGFRSTPGMGMYNASKFALEGFSEALALETAALGIKVLIVEPGPFRTKWAGGGSKDVNAKIPDYAKTAHATTQTIHGYDGNQPGDPVRGAKLIVDAVNSKNPPLRLPLGQIAIDRMRGKMDELKKEIDAWEQASISTSFAA